MIELLFNQIWDSMVNAVGSPALVCLIFMVLIFLATLYCGLEFDYGLVIISPIPYAFYRSGYLDIWVTALFIILPLGVGIWSIWLKMSNK